MTIIENASSNLAGKFLAAVEQARADAARELVKLLDCTDIGKRDLPKLQDVMSTLDLDLGEVERLIEVRREHRRESELLRTAEGEAELARLQAESGDKLDAEIEAVEAHLKALKARRAGLDAEAWRLNRTADSARQKLAKIEADYPLAVGRLPEKPKPDPGPRVVGSVPLHPTNPPTLRVRRLDGDALDPAVVREWIGDSRVVIPPRRSLIGDDLLAGPVEVIG